METSFIRLSGDKLKIKIALVSFKEDGNTMVYAPALDMYGYDIDEEKAKKSFDVVIEEYLKFTISNKTLEEDLTNLGWKVVRTENETEFVSPAFRELLDTNETLQDIFDKDFHKFNETVEIAEIA